jgi:hypothetical protein
MYIFNWFLCICPDRDMKYVTVTALTTEAHERQHSNFVKLWKYILQFNDAS